MNLLTALLSKYTNKIVHIHMQEKKACNWEICFELKKPIISSVMSVLHYAMVVIVWEFSIL